MDGLEVCTQTLLVPNHSRPAPEGYDEPACHTMYKIVNTEKKRVRVRDFFMLYCKNDKDALERNRAEHFMCEECTENALGSKANWETEDL